MKRMHGQKPLSSPGAWQEYLNATWLLARCPQEQSSRPSFDEAFFAPLWVSDIGSVVPDFAPVMVPH